MAIKTSEMSSNGFETTISWGIIINSSLPDPHGLQWLRQSLDASVCVDATRLVHFSTQKLRIFWLKPLNGKI